MVNCPPSSDDDNKIISDFLKGLRKGAFLWSGEAKPMTGMPPVAGCQRGGLLFSKLSSKINPWIPA